MLLNYINNYKDIIETINKYKIINNRDIRLIVVSKTQDYKKVIELEKLGQRDFGENYLAEAMEKINQIDNPNIIWHYIGTIQSNKIKRLSENFTWINIDNEDTKGGVSIDEYDALSLIVRNMKNMKLKGIMTIPKVNQSCIESFAKMREIYNRCDYLDTLSMGMSKDYISAIEYNANMLRIGQQIFGERK